MQTLTIDLPLELRQQLQQRGITDQQLTGIIPQLITLYLNDTTLQQTLITLAGMVQQHEVDPRLEQMRQAAHDPLFMSDLAETMTAFSHVDAEWWEPAR